MAKVTLVDFPPREIVSYTKETQTPVVTQEKEGESLFASDRLSLSRAGGTMYSYRAWKQCDPSALSAFILCGILWWRGGNLSGKYMMSYAYKGCPCVFTMWLIPAAGQPTHLHTSSMFHAACSFSSCAHCSRVLEWTLIAWLNFFAFFFFFQAYLENLFRPPSLLNLLVSAHIFFGIFKARIGS